MPKNVQAGSITSLCDYIPDKIGPLDREAKFNRLSKLMNALCDWQTKLSGFQVVFAHFSAANRFGKQYSCIWFITTLPWTLWKHLKDWIRSSKARRLQTRRLSRFFMRGTIMGQEKSEPVGVKIIDHGFGILRKWRRFLNGNHCWYSTASFPSEQSYETNK